MITRAAIEVLDNSSWLDPWLGGFIGLALLGTLVMLVFHLADVVKIRHGTTSSNVKCSHCRTYSSSANELLLEVWAGLARG